jgi:2-keto-4-pentenoate hydratase
MSTPKTQKFTLKRIVENLGNIPAKGGLGEETKQLTPEQKAKLMEMASMFENYGEALRNEEAIVNSARAMTELCELAEAYALNECGDWFQQDIVKRDMKEVKKRVGEYGKLAKECYAKMQQLGVAYQDIGHVLGRYYDLKKKQAPTDGQHAPLNEPKA